LMDDHTIGLIGGIGGGVLGVLGGVVGTYFSIKNTNGPKERALMIWAAAACCFAVTATLVGMYFTPTPYQPLVGLPLWLLLPFAIRAVNHRQEQLRRQEAHRVQPPGTELPAQ
jgi:hypothetical protein